MVSHDLILSNALVEAQSSNPLPHSLNLDEEGELIDFINSNDQELVLPK